MSRVLATACPKPRKSRKPRQGLKRGPIRKVRRTPRRIRGTRNPALMAWIHTLPCHRCHVMRGERQQSPTECSHMPESRRFGDENNVWPLCASCHREAKDSWHNAKRQWFAPPYSRSYVAFVSELYTTTFKLHPERFAIAAAYEAAYLAQGGA